MSNKNIRISDTTLCNIDDHCSFKEKIDIITKLDSLSVDEIELPAIENERADTLLLHTASPLVKKAALFCGAGFTKHDTELAWNAVKTCKRPGITVALPTSTVQMEYVCHKKAPAMLALCEELVSFAKSFGCKVEFKALDAARAERDFLHQIIKAAIGAGADTVTLCDSTGTLLPDEVKALYEDINASCGASSKDVTLGASFSDEMSIGNANAVAAVTCGAGAVKTTCVGKGEVSLASFADVLNKRSETLGAVCSVNYPTLVRTTETIRELAETKKSELSPFDNGVRDNAKDSIRITSADDIEKVISIASALGYELSDEDAEKVFESVRRLTEKKPIGKREFEVVIATSAMQIPSTYTIKSYVINSGNVISATAHIELERRGEVVSGISAGDGPIDAAFLSIEQIIGRHFELDDFQIRAITEGREAVGEALVKIRHDGKLYSGRGVSTDIIGASIRAYVKALNKICYEEDKR